jgi:acetyl esterase
MFSLDTHDRIMREYAGRAGICVIGIDYALSPEAKFPVALEQIVAVVRHVRDHAANLGVDGARLALGGDSAGGNMALAASLILRQAGEGETLNALVLNYGAFAFDMTAEDKRRYGGDGYMLTTDEMLYFWDQYLADPTDRRNALAAPLLAELHDLPPVFLCIPQCDVLHGQSLALNTRLQSAGNDVKAVIYAGASHSFLEAVSTSPLAGRAFDDASNWLKAQF